MNRITLAFPVSIILLCLSCTESPYKLNIQGPYGGRAVAIAVDPSNQSNVWVATPTGGLYESPNGGSLWSKVNSMPEFGCFDVQFCPIFTNIIIVTCVEDTKAFNGGGIWMSKDGGTTWNRPAGSIARNSRKSYRRYSAYGISFMPFSRNVFVGSDSGIIASNDLGNTWHYINPAGDNVPHTIYSVLALGNGKVIASGDEGTWISDNGQTNWYKDQDGLENNTKTKNSLAVSPDNDDVLFFTGDINHKLLYSVNGGVNWKDVDLTGFVGVNARGRRPFVKVVKSPLPPFPFPFFLPVNQNTLELYFSDLGVLGRKEIKWNGTDFDFEIDSWHTLSINHADQSDLAFDVTHRPTYVTNDGGVEKSSDGGSSWQIVGSVDNRFNALQVFDVKAVRSELGPGKDMDIYFGTQDNGFFGSYDEGLTWPFYYPPEGGNIQGPDLKAANERPYNFALLDASGGLYRRCVPRAMRFDPINFPFTPYRELEMDALYYAGENNYVAFGPDDQANIRLYASANNCFSWTETNPALFPTSIKVSNYSFISGEINPSIVTAVGARGYERGSFKLMGSTGLIRTDNVFNGYDGDETVGIIPLPVQCVIGTYGFQWRKSNASFGVDPSDRGFIIVSDIFRNQILITKNGGLMWEIRQDITDLITDNGKFLFSLRNSNRSAFELSTSQTSCIAFDPQNPDCILIGTAEAGVIFSSDHGVSWRKIKGSEQIPNITSFSFGDGIAYASSWGGGIWRIPF